MWDFSFPNTSLGTSAAMLGPCIPFLAGMCPAWPGAEHPILRQMPWGLVPSHGIKLCSCILCSDQHIPARPTPKYPGKWQGREIFWNNVLEEAARKASEHHCVSTAPRTTAPRGLSKGSGCGCRGRSQAALTAGSFASGCCSEGSN